MIGRARHKDSVFIVLCNRYIYSEESSIEEEEVAVLQMKILKIKSGKNHLKLLLLSFNHLKLLLLFNHL